MARTTNKPKVQEPLEKTFWKSADKLRKNMDAAEYKHIMLGLTFLNTSPTPSKRCTSS